MKIQQFDNEVQKNFQPKHSTTFGLEQSAVAFEVLTTSIYEHKIAAVVREICTNAYDAHIAAGCEDKPFKVCIPSEVHPYFEVEDFGIGMNVEDAFTLFTVFFASSKRGNDEEAGGFGVGCKSPFAYTKQFNVLMRKDGVESLGLVYVGSDGLPVMDIAYTTPTKECNGVKVSIPVEPKDFEQFKAEIRFYASFFKTPPIMNSTVTMMYEDAGELIGKTGMAVLQQTMDGYTRATPALGYGSVFAVVGPVPYRIDLMKFTDDLTDIEKALLRNMTSGSKCLFIKFEISEVTISVTRENLSLDAKTVESIKKRLSLSTKSTIDAMKALLTDTSIPPSKRLDDFAKNFLGETTYHQSKHSFYQFNSLIREVAPDVYGCMRFRPCSVVTTSRIRVGGRRLYQQYQRQADLCIYDMRVGGIVIFLRKDPSKDIKRAVWEDVNDKLKGVEFRHIFLRRFVSQASLDRIEREIGRKVVVFDIDNMHDEYVAAERERRKLMAKERTQTPRKKYESASIESKSLFISEGRISTSYGSKQARFVIDEKTVIDDEGIDSDVFRILACSGIFNGYRFVPMTKRNEVRLRKFVTTTTKDVFEKFLDTPSPVLDELVRLSAVNKNLSYGYTCKPDKHIFTLATVGSKLVSDEDRDAIIWANHPYSDVTNYQWEVFLYVLKRIGGGLLEKFNSFVDKIEVKKLKYEYSDCDNLLINEAYPLLEWCSVIRVAHAEKDRLDVVKKIVSLCDELRERNGLKSPFDPQNKIVHSPDDSDEILVEI